MPYLDNLRPSLNATRKVVGRTNDSLLIPTPSSRPKTLSIRPEELSNVPEDDEMMSPVKKSVQLSHVE